MALSTNAKIAIAVGVTAAVILIVASKSAAKPLAAGVDPALIAQVTNKAIASETDQNVLMMLSQKLNAAGYTSLSRAVDARVAQFQHQASLLSTTGTTSFYGQ